MQSGIVFPGDSAQLAEKAWSLELVFPALSPSLAGGETSHTHFNAFQAILQGDNDRWKHHVFGESADSMDSGVRMTGPCHENWPYCHPILFA